MLNLSKLRRITEKIFENTVIRVSFLLLCLLLVMTLTLVILTIAFHKRTNVVEWQIQEARTNLITLQKAVTETTSDQTEMLLGSRSFAPYGEIVPFITVLETLFGLIDEKAEIMIKDDEGKILANRYADYEVELKVGDKKELLFKALNELHDSKYLVKIMKLNVDYASLSETKDSQPNHANITLRLYFE